MPEGIADGVVAALAGVAFVAGLVDAIAGGGGLLTIPALLAAGLPPHAALATNKGQAVFGSGIAAWTFARRGALDWQLARTTFPLGLIGSLAGAYAVTLLPPQLLKPVVIVLLPVAALSLFLRKRGHAGPPPKHRVAIAALIAVMIGGYDGFFGPGTGAFLIVSFATLLHAPLLRASADAKVVNFASNLAAIAMFTARGNVFWNIALPMAVGQLAGGFVGAHVAVRGGDRTVRAFVLVVASALVVKLTWEFLA
jgi:uncharacterized membrane protein YfcA